MPQPHEALQAVLQQRVGFEVVQLSAKTNQVRYFGRVRSSYMPTWLEAMRELLVVSEKAPWSIDLSRQYFLRGEKLFFGWRIILQGENLQIHLPQITDLIQRVKVMSRQLDEVPLNARADRNALRNGKGAQPTGTAVVGPLAKANMGM